MDIDFISPQLTASQLASQTENGALHCLSLTEGIAVRSQDRVISVKQMCDKLEHLHLFIPITVNDSFLPGAHLVHKYAGRYAKSFFFNDLSPSTDTFSRGNELVCRFELTPVETAFLQSPREEILPCRRRI